MKSRAWTSDYDGSRNIAGYLLHPISAKTQVERRRQRQPRARPDDRPQVQDAARHHVSKRPKRGELLLHTVPDLRVLVAVLPEIFCEPLEELQPADLLSPEPMREGAARLIMAAIFVHDPPRGIGRPAQADFCVD